MLHNWGGWVTIANLIKVELSLESRVLVVKTKYFNFIAWSSKKFEIDAQINQSKIITNTLANKTG